jgi:hypothetical protein
MARWSVCGLRSPTRGDPRRETDPPPRKASQGRGGNGGGGRSDRRHHGRPETVRRVEVEALLARCHGQAALQMSEHRCRWSWCAGTRTWADRCLRRAHPEHQMTAADEEHRYRQPRRPGRLRDHLEPGALRTVRQRRSLHLGRPSTLGYALIGQRGAGLVQDPHHSCAATDSDLHGSSHFPHPGIRGRPGMAISRTGHDHCGDLPQSAPGRYPGPTGNTVYPWDRSPRGGSTRLMSLAGAPPSGGRARARRATRRARGLPALSGRGSPACGTS